MYNTGPLGTILVVDDDANITDLLRFNLESEGYGVNVVKNAKDVDVNEIQDYRMVIADAFNQDYTGLDLLVDIKSNANTATIPVIICTSSEGEDSVIDAFDKGSDDFIIKPFSLRELIARIKAVLRRHPRKSADHRQRSFSQDIEIPNLNLHIDTIAQRVIADDEVVPLTKTEYSILLFLIKHQNSFFTRTDICNQVWKDDASSNERIVDTNISRLRKKLGDAGKYIVNRYGLGYAFIDKLS